MLLLKLNQLVHGVVFFTLKHMQLCRADCSIDCSAESCLRYHLQRHKH